MYHSYPRPSLLAFLLLLAVSHAAGASSASDCDVEQPDTLHISWTAPCEDGSWFLDPEGGCRVWDWRPEPEDAATWTGACSMGLKEGPGKIQWFEHGRPIDRFEGRFEQGSRKGFGRYYWPAGEQFEGYYAANVPNGQGTATIGGVSYAGTWRQGCLVYKDRLIAIGVPLINCNSPNSAR